MRRAAAVLLLLLLLLLLLQQLFLLRGAVDGRKSDTRMNDLGLSAWRPGLSRNRLTSAATE
jgi:hypothetical protein